MEVPEGPRHDTIDGRNREMNRPKCQLETDICLRKPFRVVHMHLRK